ncbi:MAG: glycosyltransferase [Holophagaceae bacterium]|nr:glycosyltransferase [Holophagaceae bacterium]
MGDQYPALAGKRVCLITSGPIGSDPRLVKEAESLHRHGAMVQVLCLDVSRLEHLQRRNASVLAGADWACAELQGGGRGRQSLLALGQRLARLLLRAGFRSMRLTARAFNRNAPRLRRKALQHPADLYVAHNLAALPAAHAAAHKHRAKLGFDAEDFHSGELPEGRPWDFERNLAGALEAAYLPQCDYVTAASPGIARAYTSVCGIPEPRTVLNVFPLAMAAAPAPSDDPRSLYWFSQTVGPDRGLEDVIKAIGAAQSKPHVYLRGTISATYRNELHRLAKASRSEGQLHFLPPEAPDEMGRLAARYHLGLATEPGGTPNSRIALSNKCFTYMLAGIPSIATATLGQAELASEAPGAIFLYPPGESLILAELLDQLMRSPAQVAEARTLAWSYGQGRFNWEREQHVFLEEVSRVLASS